MLLHLVTARAEHFKRIYSNYTHLLNACASSGLEGIDPSWVWGLLRVLAAGGMPESLTRPDGADKGYADMQRVDDEGIELEIHPPQLPSQYRGPNDADDHSDESDFRALDHHESRHICARPGERKADSAEDADCRHSSIDYCA